MMGISGGDRKKPKGGWTACYFCNTKDHSAKGFSKEVRKEHCKAAKSKCKKCSAVGHFTDCCVPGKTSPGKKAKVAAVSVEETAAAAVAPAVAPPAVSAALATGPAASLSSVAQVSDYHFDPNRYAGDNLDNGSWWAFEAVKPISSRRIWAAMEAQTTGKALGHFLFDKINNVWKSASPPGHAAKHVKVEIDRMSYKNQGRTKMNRKSLDKWSFPDSGAQVTLISPKLVRALGGEGLVQQASLQIKGATGHVLKTSGCLFIVITRKDEQTGVFQKTHQQAYISADVDSVVLSREAMESLKLVSDLDDRKKANVSLISNTLMQPLYANPVSPVISQRLGKSSSPVPVASDVMGKSSSPGGVPAAGASLRASGMESSRLQLESTYVRERHRSLCPTRAGAGVHSTHVKVLPGLKPSSAGEARLKAQTGLEPSSAVGAKSEYVEYNPSDRVQGGQVTLDLLATHNVDFPASKVSLSDLKVNTDPEHKCRGSLPLKNGILTCGCYIRKEAPDPISYKDVVGFENMSRDALRRLIIQQYAQSGFNNCRIQPLRMMRGSPLRLFVDKSVKPVAIHKAEIIPVHLKARVKADLDRDVRLGILEKVDINSPVKWLSRMLVTLKKDGSPRRIIDFKNLNNAIPRQTNITMSPFLCASACPTNKNKSILDAKDGYHSVELEEGESRVVTEFLCEFGRYRCVQGLICSGDAYTHRFDNITSKFQNVVRCVDDSLLWEDDLKSSFDLVCKYLSTCSKGGINFNRLRSEQTPKN